MTTDKIVLEVMEDLNKRSEIGLKKYGVGLDRTDLSLKDFLIHQYEELLDAALYCKRAIKEIVEAEKINLWKSDNYSPYHDPNKLVLIPPYKTEEALPNWLITELHPKERLNVNDLLERKMHFPEETNQEDEEYYSDREI